MFGTVVNVAWLYPGYPHFDVKRTTTSSSLCFMLERKLGAYCHPQYECLDATLVK